MLTSPVGWKILPLILWVWERRILMGKIWFSKLTHSMCNCAFKSQREQSACGLPYGDVKCQRICTTVSHSLKNAAYTISTMLTFKQLLVHFLSSFINFICMPICNICWIENSVFYVSIQNGENSINWILKCLKQWSFSAVLALVHCSN